MTTGLTNRRWFSLASSLTGGHLAAGGDTGLYVSTDSGSTWSSNCAVAPGFYFVAASADGTRLAAAVGGPYDGPIYTSTDSGATWEASTAPSEHWQCIASSADGNQLIAGTMNAGTAIEPDLTYTSHFTRAPSLNIASTEGDVVISWIVPSMNLVLEQNPDLSPGNWTVQTNIPTLDLATLRNQVTLSPSARQSFLPAQESVNRPSPPSEQTARGNHLAPATKEFKVER